MNRELVLHEIRRAITSAPGLRARSALPPRPTPPTYGEQRIERFTDRLVAHACTWEAIAELDELPQRVVAWLEQRQLDHRLAVAPPLMALNWPEKVDRHSRPAAIDESVAVSLAFAGIAESGSLVMYSGPNSPITHNYVPEFHLVAIRADDVCDNQEAVWANARALGDMPRALNLIAGPSRTGDVEQTIQLGAHGPRQVHVLLVRAKDMKS
ncbi:MAG: LUD domain-containing protein [Rhodocyclaceae bacterium]|nr:LUD domain-containing protein [Rhodocyclaceae bacterium]